jgi:predicted small secreted protein
MKKSIYVITILAILSVLAACNQTTTAQSGMGGNTTPLSTATQLLVGTFKLEDTDLAVSADQAKQLLPLWQTLQELSTSNTAADQEINAVVDQIKSTMTSLQMAKITAMKLTQQDIMSVMSQAGLSPNGAGATTTPMALNGFPGGNNSQGGGGTAGGGAQVGGAPAGGPPSGGVPGGGMPFGGGMDPGVMGETGGASTTPQAIRQMPNQVPAPLLNALIDLLQKKIK